MSRGNPTRGVYKPSLQEVQSSGVEEGRSQRKSGVVSEEDHPEKIPTGWKYRALKGREPASSGNPE